MKVYQTILFQIEDRIAHISLNVPETGNAFTDVMVIELQDAFLRAEQSEAVKVMVLDAKGDQFCSGIAPAYLERMLHYNLQQHAADSSALAQLYMTVYRSTKVVIAKVQGDVLDIGCGLIAACDFVYAVPQARLGFSEVRQGMAAAIPMNFLLRKIGELRTKEMLLSGRFLLAEQAERYNLINQSVPADKIEETVSDLAGHLCNLSSASSLQLSKKMIADLPSFPLEDAIKFSARMNAYSRATDDAKRWLAARINGDSVQW